MDTGNQIPPTGLPVLGEAYAEVLWLRAALSVPSATPVMTLPASALCLGPFAHLNHDDLATAKDQLCAGVKVLGICVFKSMGEGLKV